MNFETWHRLMKQYSLLLSLPAIPDWNTSYLWYDRSALDYHDDPDQVVEDYTLEARYPGLAPFYWAWQKVYEDAFEMQGCHLGYSQTVFTNLNEQVSWEVAGFLVASWLVLQDTVEGVEYDPSGVGIYNLTRENLAEVTGQFLEDENALLSDGAPLWNRA